MTILANSKHLDDARQVEVPIDEEVFMRMLRFYEIRWETERPSGAPTKMNAAQLATAAHRRK